MSSVDLSLYCTYILYILDLGDLKKGLGKCQSVMQSCHRFILQSFYSPGADDVDLPVILFFYLPARVT